MLYGHGDDGFRYKDIKLDFSSNLFYSGIDPKVITHLATHLKDIGNYPEPCAAPVRKLLAKEHGVDVENIIVTNGATEAFYLIAQHLRRSRSMIYTPTFAEYEDACTANEHQLSFENWNNFDGTLKTDADNIWICNPNNPTGQVIKRGVLEQMFKNYPERTFVIDEAYINLCADNETITDLVEKYPNVIVVHSLTKCCCIPGLRLGYLVSNKQTIQKIEHLKMPWSVNSLAIAAGLYVLPQRKQLLLGLKHLIKNAQSLAETLNQDERLEALPTKTNFILVRTKVGKAVDLKEFLANNYGFLIRNADNFRGLDKGYFRICVKTRKENMELNDAIKAWLNTL